jgi:serine/threonine protein kinase/MinD-like ATPase involved in chromosome partitioning or flagellar assembly
MIYTFYSYKGGVGRSMALANVAELLYAVGLDVLMVDWDLEAPGLERFFADKSGEGDDERGVIDMLLEYKRMVAQDLEFSPETAPDLPFEKPEDLARDIYAQQPSGARLRLITAGRRSRGDFASYAQSVLTFDWDDFYANWKGEPYFEWLREKLNEAADIVLIDSRTGVTEMGGVCTYQLADVVVLLCAPNQQNIDGIYRMAKNFTHPDVRKSRRDRPLEVVIVPARVEDRAESGAYNEFSDDFIAKFDPLISDSLKSEIGSFWELEIPYVPYYAFNEIVAVRERHKKFAEDIVGSFTTIMKTMICLEPENSRVRQKVSGNLRNVSRNSSRSKHITQSLVGRTVCDDRYKIEKRLGQSLHSTTYLAIDTTAAKEDHQVAIKQSNTEDDKLNALLDEFDRYKRLMHPLLPTVRDRFFMNSRFCVVTKYIPGKDLHHYLGQDDVPAPVPFVLGWIHQILDILSYLHTQEPPVVHMDIKPSNIRISNDTAQAYLLDLGISQAIDQPYRKPIGTRGYAAPEQYQPGASITPATDIYAVGATLYHLLTGVVPPDASELSEKALLFPTKRNPSLDSELDQIILKAMSIEPHERYQSAQEMLEALQPILHRLGIEQPACVMVEEQVRDAPVLSDTTRGQDVQPDTSSVPETDIAPTNGSSQYIPLPRCLLQLTPGHVIDVNKDGIKLNRDFILQNLPKHRTLGEQARWSMGFDSPLSYVSRNPHCEIYAAGTQWMLRAYNPVVVNGRTLKDGATTDIASSTSVRLGGSKGWAFEVLVG